MRWLVGDIQGCVLEFERLLKAIDFEPARDELWCLGDLVNRGPHSLEVLRLWRDIGGRGVLGNHDIYALLAFDGVVPRGADTLEPLLTAADGAELLSLLRALPILHLLPGTAGVAGLWIVHAGLHPHWADLATTAASLNAVPHSNGHLQSPDIQFATNVRCCNSSGESADHLGHPRDCPPPYEPWDQFYSGEARVVHGHWALRGRYRGERTIGLDSGCVYGGALTAWCPEEDRFVEIQSGIKS